MRSLTCDQCGISAPTQEWNGHRLEIYPESRVGGDAKHTADLCSWRCLSNYATDQRTKGR